MVLKSKTEVLGEKTLSIANLPTTNLTETGLGLNLGLYSDRRTIGHLRQIVFES
jgi:hypothetical protein